MDILHFMLAACFVIVCIVAWLLNQAVDERDKTIKKLQAANRRLTHGVSTNDLINALAAGITIGVLGQNYVPSSSDDILNADTLGGDDNA